MLLPSVDIDFIYIVHVMRRYASYVLVLFEIVIVIVICNVHTEVLLYCLRGSGVLQTSYVVIVT